MERNELLEKITEIFRDVMVNDDIVLTEETTSYDIEEWDSVSHIQLIDEVEQKFGIKFTAKEMLAWEDVGEFMDAIQSKLK